MLYFILLFFICCWQITNVPRFPSPLDPLHLAPASCNLWTIWTGFLNFPKLTRQSNLSEAMWTSELRNCSKCFKISEMCDPSISLQTNDSKKKYVLTSTLIQRVYNFKIESSGDWGDVRNCDSQRSWFAISGMGTRNLSLISTVRDSAANGQKWYFWVTLGQEEEN